MISEGNIDTRTERRTIKMVNIWVNIIDYFTLLNYLKYLT